MDETIKKYDTIILTYAPNDDLIISLQSLLTESIVPENIFIINTDENLFKKNITNRLVFDKLLNEEIIKVIHIEKKDFDHGKTRNEASKYVESDYILFLTDDAIPYDSKLAENLLFAFDDEKVAISYARQVAKPKAKLKERYVREFNYKNYDIVKDKNTYDKYGIKNIFCSNSCAMYDKNKFFELGKFDENIIQNEDMLFSYKAIENGYKVVYKSDAKVLHSHNLSFIEQFRRNFDIGVFQKINENIFNKMKSEKEGFSLLIYVLLNLAKKFHFLMCIDFIIECIFRFVGFKLGKNYEKLPIKYQIKFSNNKEFFIKKL